MQALFVNYVLLLASGGIIFRELYLSKQSGRSVKWLSVAASALIFCMALLAVIRGVPISDLQVEIEAMFGR